MIFLTGLDFTLPLTNPVIVFSIVLFIILFAPILLNRFKFPPIIGLILAGIAIGPYGFGLLLRDSSIVLFGTVGLLYIMFTAGLEIDLEEFKKNRVKSVVFGLYTFLIPMALGTLAAFYLLNYELATAVLLASMFASHTLLAYPIASRYGIARSRSVTLTIGGTIITDILSLLVLATVVGMYSGEIGPAFWIRLAGSSIVFAGCVFILFPIIARWFFKNFDDNVSQYIFVLALVFLGSFLAEAAGLEAIIGAFLSGLAVNRFIPHSSPLMNRIEFVGNALFIPFFLISVGMLVDFKVLFQGFGALKVAAVMIVMAIVTKFIAAWLTQKTFRLSSNERQLIFGLSNARVGATLAVVLVGYNVILGETAAGVPIRLLNEDVLNGTILMILVTCIVSSFVVEKSARIIALQETVAKPLVENEAVNNMLISLAYPDTVPNLIDLALLLQDDQIKAPLYALHVVSDKKGKSAGEAAGKKMIESAVKRAAATDNTVIPITRFDLNISNGIINTINEYNITDTVIGLHHQAEQGHAFFGHVTEKILDGTSESVIIYKPVQPLNTLNRIMVAVPPNAEYEKGFSLWVIRVLNMSVETGMPIVIYGREKTIKMFSSINHSNHRRATVTSVLFEDWDEFLFLTREVRKDDLLIIISSRKGYLSYIPQIDKLPNYLLKYFKNTSYIIVYPAQAADTSGADLKPLTESSNALGKAGKYVKNIFRRDS